MTQSDLQKYSQQLVDMEIEKRRLIDEQIQLKLEIFDNAKDGIKCTGGFVKYFDEGTFKIIDIDKIKENLENYGLPKKDIENIIDTSYEEKKKTAFITVRLD